MRPIYAEIPVLFIEDCEKITGIPCKSTDFKPCDACDEIAYNCGDEAIQTMDEKGYDVYDLSGPYISDEAENRGKWTVWTKCFKKK